MKRLILLLGVCLLLVGVVSAVTPNYIYTGKFGSFGSGEGQFDTPYDIAVDPNGIMYVLDSGNNRVQKFSSTGVFIKEWGTVGGGIGQFDNPSGITVNADGSSVYVADTVNNRIQKFNSNGEYQSSFPFDFVIDVAVDPFGDIYGVGEDLPYTFAKISAGGTVLWSNILADSPGGVTISPDGYIYVTEDPVYEEPSILKYNSSGGYISGTAISTGGAGGAGDFSLIYGITTDPLGNIFAVDVWDNDVQMFTSDGIYVTTFGRPGVYEDYPSDVMNGYLNYPQGICSDASGNIWVADARNDRMQRFSVATGVVPTASFTVSPLSGDYGFTSNLVSTSTPGDSPILNTTWAVYYPGDPATLVSDSIPQTPTSSFTVSTYGPYVIYLTVRNEYGFDTTSQLVWMSSGVNPPPLSTGGGNISWDKPNYISGEPANITYNIDNGYFDLGTYVYSVWITRASDGNTVGTYPIITQVGSVNISSISYSPGTYYANLKWTKATDPSIYSVMKTAMMNVTTQLQFVGWVKNAETVGVISGANVSITQGAISENIVTNGNGYYQSNSTIFNAGGTLTIQSDYPGFEEYSRDILPLATGIKTVNISLVPTSPVCYGVCIGGLVLDNVYGNPVVGATVNVRNGTTYQNITNIAGYYRVDNLVANTLYDVWSTKAGYGNSTTAQKLAVGV